jgi:uncharacterized protein
MQGNLQRRYQVQKEVTRGGGFQGNFRVRDLPRLSEFLYSDEGIVEIEFEIVRGDFEATLLTGRMKTCLSIECQRCLKAMEKPMSMEFSLLVDATDELVGESSLDTIYSEDGYIDIFEVVEDEIMLGLPLVNMHDDQACNEYWPVEQQHSEQVTENPFSVLEKLKTH